MNNSLIDIKSLWKVLSIIILTVSISCLVGTYIFLIRQADFELDTQINRALTTVGDQITYGNYRKAIETLFSDSEVSSVEIVSTDGAPIKASRNYQSFFKVCKNKEIPNGRFEISICKIQNRIGYTLFSILFITFVILFLGYFYLQKIEENASKRLKNALNDFGISFSDSSNKSFSSLFEEMNVAAKLFKASRTMEIQLVSLKSKNETSEQVAHDIRSPLSALEMLSGTFSEIPDEKKILFKNALQRIRDIANTLDGKNNNYLSEFVANSDTAQRKLPTLNELIHPILDSIVSESRLKYNNISSIEIDFIASTDSVFSFSSINKTELNRIISNLINNSVEALVKNSGKVKICLSSTDKEIVIEISDNGKGIPENLISKLGNRGATFDKEGGTGLGLYHASSTIKSWGGNLSIISNIGKGTSIFINLIKSKKEDWFLDAINVSKDSTIIIVDDEKSIHNLWQYRFGQTAPNSSLITLNNTNELREFYRKKYFLLNKPIFLIDFNFLNQNETGLEVISNLGIAEEAVLVTSMYDKPDVLDGAKKLNLKILPKSMAGVIPIFIA